MYFHSLHDLIHMNGLGVYVWSVYAVAVLIIGWLVVTPLLTSRRLLRAEAFRLARRGGSQAPSAGADQLSVERG